MAEEHYELKYFNIRGLAEPIRLLLHDNEIPFKDVQITQAEWPSIKDTMIFGQMPCLYIKGIPLAQSGAIIRHLARKHDLYGSDLASGAYIDMVYEAIGDLRKKYYDLIYRDVETRQQFATKTASGDLQCLEKLTSSRQDFLPGRTSQFVAGGDRATFVDYALFEMMDILLVLDPKILNDFPLMKGHHDMMSKRPNMAKYLNSAARKDMKINGNGKQ